MHIAYACRNGAVCRLQQSGLLSIIGPSVLISRVSLIPASAAEGLRCNSVKDFSGSCAEVSDGNCVLALFPHHKA